MGKVSFQLKSGLSYSFTFTSFWKNISTVIWPWNILKAKTHISLPLLLPLYWAQSFGKQAMLGEPDWETMTNYVCVCVYACMSVYVCVYSLPLRIFNPSLPRSPVLWVTEQAFWPGCGSSHSHSWLAPGGGEVSFRHLRLLQEEVSKRLSDILSKRHFYKNESDCPGRMDKERRTGPNPDTHWYLRVPRGRTYREGEKEQSGQWCRGEKVRMCDITEARR